MALWLSHHKCQRYRNGSVEMKIYLKHDLQGLNLADNALTEVPVETLRTLRILSSLDLTNNRVQYVPNNAFVTLRWIVEHIVLQPESQWS